MARKLKRNAAKAVGKNPSSIREEKLRNKKIKQLAKRLTPSIDEVFFDPEQKRYGVDYKRDVTEKDLLGEFSRSTLSDMIATINNFTVAQSEFEVHYRNSNGSLRCEDIIETSGGYEGIHKFMEATWKTGVQLINHVVHVMNKIRKEEFPEAEERFVAVFTKELNPEDPSGALFGQYKKDAANLLDITKNLREIQNRFVSGLPYYILLKKLPMSNNEDLREACKTYSEIVSSSIGSNIHPSHTQDESTDRVLAFKTDKFMDQIKPQICKSNLNAQKYFEDHNTEESVLKAIRMSELGVLSMDTITVILAIANNLINENGTISYDKLKEEAKHEGTDINTFAGRIESSIITFLMGINNLIAISHYSILRGYDQVLEEIKNGYKSILILQDEANEENKAESFEEAFKEDNEILLGNLATIAELVPDILHFAHLKDYHFNNEPSLKKLNQKYLKTKSK